MKKVYIVFIGLAVSATSVGQVNEAFEPIAREKIQELNDSLSRTSNKLSPVDIMRLYYPYGINYFEGRGKQTIIVERLDDGAIQVVLMAENFLDDSINGEKHVMELGYQRNRWKILSIKKNWKCQPGKGHSTWGTTLCK